MVGGWSCYELSYRRVDMETGNGNFREGYISFLSFSFFLFLSKRHLQRDITLLFSIYPHREASRYIYIYIYTLCIFFFFNFISIPIYPPALSPIDTYLVKMAFFRQRKAVYLLVAVDIWSFTYRNLPHRQRAFIHANQLDSAIIISPTKTLAR